MVGTWEELQRRQRRRDRRLKIGGAVILLAGGFFLARFHLTKIPSYQKIEGNVVKTLKLDRAGEQAARVLGLEEDGEKAALRREEEKKRREREAVERPRLEIAPPAPPPQPPRYRVTPLVEKEYLPALLRGFTRAEKSIYVAMFLAAPDPPRGPVTRLLNGLIAAAKRGVEVKVALNHPGETEDSVYDHNRAAIAYLQEGGVEAYFNDPGKSLHDKFVLIDDKVLILGNHNWTKQALTAHLEISLLVESDPPDPAFARYFGSIVLAKWEETPEGRRELIEKLYEELLSRGKKKG